MGGGEWTSEDKRRFKQFDDLWRFNGHSNTWEELRGVKKRPAQRSGHRMCVLEDHLVIYGGFTETKTGAKYLADVCTWSLEANEWRKSTVARGPGPRAGGCFWASDGVAYYFAGTRERKRKGGSDLEVLADVWSYASGSWTFIETTGTAPPARSGWGHAPSGSGGCLLFGGVEDIPSNGEEINAFFNDMWHIDPLDGVWSCLWSPVPRNLSFGDKKGGVDVVALLPKYCQKKLGTMPRGRMACGCSTWNGALWVFGGMCEAGPKQEVTLDDLWRFDLTTKSWECILRSVRGPANGSMSRHRMKMGRPF